MQIEGTYTLQAPTQEVWTCLLDEQNIQQALPGLERLTRLEDHTYTFAIHLRHAPLRGSYTGKARVESDTPTTFRVQIEGEGPNDMFKGECAVQLKSQDENTVVSYQGSLQLGRGKMLISAPLLKATVRVLLQNFFTALSDQLRSAKEGLVYVTTLEEMYEMPFMDEQTSEQLARARQVQSPTLLHWLVRRLGLGQGSPEQEELWVRRLRRAGIIAVLLLLVWVGTRLPRRLAPRSTRS